VATTLKKRKGMALKSPANVYKSWLPQRGPGGVIQINQKDEIEPFSGAMEETRETVFEEDLFNPSALGEMLKLNEYQVVLVRPTQRGSRLEAFSDAPPTVLLPFSWADLVAGVFELVRNSTRLAERRVSQFADFCVDFIKMEVSRLSGEVISLNRQEFKMLQCFLSNPERVLSRDELLNEAWGYECYPSTRTVDNHVCKLRRKFELDPVRPVHFRTVHGVGYKFVP
jgi:DNA-binding response OmpR family regulator